MASVLTAETDVYAEMWGHESYSTTSPAETYVPVFAEVAQKYATVLDAGCGTGRGAVALTTLGYKVTCCDLTDAGLVEAAKALPFMQATLWSPLRARYVFGGAYDWVFCCDVLEHLPTEFTMLALARLLEVSRVGLFLTVATQPDNFGVWVDRQLHQTVRDFAWWRDRLAELGTVKDARDLLINALFVVEPIR